MVISTMRPRLSKHQRRRHKLRNRLQSFLLLGGMVLVFAVCGHALWGPQGFVWAMLGAALGLAFSPRMTPDLVMRMYRARPITPAEFPQGYRMLDGLARRAGLPRTPTLHYLPSRMLNAFAVGRRDEAAIGITDGLIRALEPRELAGVLAHELSHVRNNDLWVMNLADTISRIVALMAWFGQILLFLNIPLIFIGYTPVPWTLVFMLLLAPMGVALLQLALSRAREFDADLDAAGLTGDPRGLASALIKLERRQAGFWEGILLPGRRAPEPSLLRTHPPTEERVRRLMELYEEVEPEPAPEVDVAPPSWARLVDHPPRYRWPGVWY
jgi:heat shock protein HtpX